MNGAWGIVGSRRGTAAPESLEDLDEIGIGVGKILSSAKNCTNLWHTPSGTRENANGLAKTPAAFMDCWQMHPEGYDSKVYNGFKVPIAHAAADRKLASKIPSDGSWAIGKVGNVFFPSKGRCADPSDMVNAISDLLGNDTIPLSDRTFLDTDAGVATLDVMLQQKLAVQTIATGAMGETIEMSPTLLSSQRGVPTFIDLTTPQKRFHAPPSSFDVVHCCWCRARFREYAFDVQRLLKPNGYFLVDTFHSLQFAKVLAEVELEHVGFLASGKFVSIEDGSPICLKDGSTSKVTELGQADGADQPAEGTEPCYSVYKKKEIEKDDERETCSNYDLRTDEIEECLSTEKGVSTPKPEMTAFYSTILASLKSSNVMRHHGEMVTALFANVNPRLPRLLLEGSQFYLGRPRARVQVVVADKGKTGRQNWASPPATVEHDWCRDSLPSHPRSWNMVYIGDFPRFVKDCKERTHQDEAAIVAHLVLESYRLLRPYGHLVISAKHEKMDLIGAYLDSEGGYSRFEEMDCSLVPLEDKPGHFMDVCAMQAMI